MAITFPRELPAVGYATADFTLNDPVKSSASGAQRFNYTQISDPVWEARLITTPLDYWQVTELEAWWLSLREGIRGGVLFRHPRVCFPRSHSHNQAPAEVPGNLASVTNGNVLAVNAVNSGLSLTIGDRIGLERAGRYHVGKITEVTGSGTSRTITIEPPPPAAVTASGTIVRFARPAVHMRPMPGTWAPRESEGLYIVSFQLREAR